MREILILSIFAGALFLAADVKAQTTASVTLQWNPSSSPNVAGYDIYYGTSNGSYITYVPVSNVTNVTIRGLISGATYYFAAASYDSSGNYSALSPEISGVAGSAPSVAGILSSALVSSAGQFGFMISGATGYQYEVQASTDLVHWVTLETNTPPFSFVDSNSSQYKQRFYRTISIPN